MRFGRAARITSALMLVLAMLAGVQQPAGAVPGDRSNAEGQFLSGTLLASDLALVAALDGETASSDGTASETNSGTLDLTALGLINLTIPGGVQVPLSLTDAGVVGQYASALDDGSSVGSSGLIQSDGSIGTGGTPAPGVAPGPLSLSLGGVVSDLALDPLLGPLVAEVAQLNLQVDGVSAHASQAAPASPVGDYAIDDVKLTFQSATLAALVAEVNAAASVTQGELDGLQGALNASLGGLFSLLSGLGVVDVNVNVTVPNLAAAIAGLTSGTISDPAFPGVIVDLDTGLVSVDLDELTSLNGLPPNTDILTDVTINAITTNLTGLLQSHLVTIQDTLLDEVDSTAITGGVTSKLPFAPTLTILGIDTSIGDIRAGDTSGITLLGLGLGLPGGVSAVLAALLSPVTVVTDTLVGLSDDLLAPVLANVVPALKPVLDEVVGITVNNQSTNAGVFTETALRITVLPSAAALSLDVATAKVGPNALAPTPVISDLTPTSGPTAGGTTVTITGTGFLGTTEVTFDGTSGTDLVVVSDTEITVTTPPHAEGTVPVVVTASGGDSAPGEFTYIAPPVITDLTPTSGPTAGGTEVTITGSGFTDATGVTFDGNPGTSFEVVSDTEIKVTTPAGTAGPVDVIVSGPGGDSDAGEFTYIAPPVITDLTPTSGPTAGGTEVTITGSGFTDATGVTFDGNPGTSFEVVSDTEIKVTTPAGTAGPVDVIVSGPGGDSDAGEFTYIAPPVITDLTPTSGPTAGGTEVTITGSGFTDATGVTFDGNPGTSFEVVSDTEIKVTTPAGTAGPVDVIVSGPGGDSDAGEFTYIAPPVITDLTPTSGPTAGGTEVTITGSGFTDATGVTFDGNPGTSFEVVSDTEIKVTTPAGTAGPVDVIVSGPGGDSDAGEFTYIAPPVITDLTPTSGPTAGGTEVTITGSGFTDATGVTFDGNAGTDFEVVSDTEIKVTTPAGTAGPVDVIVSGPGGDSDAGEFTYIAPPVITDLTPTSGPTAGGTEVTITGSGFTDATGVTFDGTPGTSFEVVSDTEIKVTTPAGTAGPVDVIVSGPGGDSDAGEFTYIAPTQPAPVIDGLTPTSGPTAGGTEVTITGSGFTDATGVTFDGTPGTSFEVVSDTEIKVTTPAGTAGPVDVIVSGPGGDSDAGEFTYIAPTQPAPVIDGLTPNEGPTAGGTEVTITGSGFTDATGVTFDGTPGTSFEVVSDTEIKVTTPAGTAGPVDVIVSGPGGDSDAGEFTCIAPTQPAPVIDGLTPNEGPTAGGTVVTITGSGFTDATGVTFDGTPGTSFEIVSDTEIKVTTPAGTAGPVDVIVSGPGGDSDPGDFTYIAPIAVLDSLTPTSGPTSGGTVVTITGSGFTDATGVAFDGIAGTDFEIVSDTEIKVTTPAHAAGPVEVVVTSPGGDSDPGEFTYEADPAGPSITTIDPNEGPTTGGTEVTITGSGFTDATGVTFDGTPGTSFEVVSDTEIKVTTPPGSEGSASVIVESPNGASEPGDFTYIASTQPAPVIDGLTPNEGPVAGGTVVTITGSGFTDATGVTFDGTPGTSFEVVSDTEIKVTTPPGSEGSASVIVESPNGASEPGDFTYIAPTPTPPQIDEVDPGTGPTTGGTVVTITGSGFTGATEVTFGGVPGTNLEVISDTEIRVTTPPHAAGTVDVVVTTPNGSSNAGSFEFTDPDDDGQPEPPTTPGPGDDGPTPPSGPTDGGDPDGDGSNGDGKGGPPSPVAGPSGPPPPAGAPAPAAQPQVGGSSQAPAAQPAPAAAPAPAPAAAQAPSSSLATTGLASGGIVLVALILSLLGGAMVVSGRRRRRGTV